MSVTVDAAGTRDRGRGNGSATITATADEASGRAQATVRRVGGLRRGFAARAHDRPGGHTAFRGGSVRPERTPGGGGGFFLVVERIGGWRPCTGRGWCGGLPKAGRRLPPRRTTCRAPRRLTVANPDRAGLVALYEATDGPNWINNEGWLSDAPLDEWYGGGNGRIRARLLARSPGPVGPGTEGVDASRPSRHHPGRTRRTDKPAVPAAQQQRPDRRHPPPNSGIWSNSGA